MTSYNEEQGCSLYCSRRKEGEVCCLLRPRPTKEREITVTLTGTEAHMVKECCNRAPHIRWDETVGTAVAKLERAMRTAGLGPR